MKKLKQVMLVDGDWDGRQQSRRALSQSGIAHKIVDLASSREALDYLATPENNTYPRPDLIFLEIELSDRDGWEFLEQLSSLPDECTDRSIVCMLTDASSEENVTRARANRSLRHFIAKPLTLTKISNILAANFKK